MEKITNIFKKIWNSYRNWLGDKTWYKNWKVWLSIFVIMAIAIPIEDDEEAKTEAAEPEVETVTEVDSKEDSEPIEVDIEVTSVIEENQEVYIEGETNLPDYAELMIGVLGEEYTGQTKTIVKNGSFKTEAFTDDGNKLSPGEYELSISLSIPKGQDDRFIQEAGNDYEYLTGELMTESEFGKSMSYSTTFEIQGSEDDEVEEEEVVDEVDELSFDPADYNKELTYDDLARSPDEHMYQKVTFEGKIIQVMQDDGYSQFRIATNDNYDKVMLLEIDNSQLDTRILDDDYIRFYGLYMGEITYQSTLGGNITIPGVVVDQFEFQ